MTGDQYLLLITIVDPGLPHPGLAAWDAAMRTLGDAPSVSAAVARAGLNLAGRIVTAKIVVTPAVPVDLPQASKSEALQTVFSVVLPVDGSLLVDGVPVSDEALSEKARAALARDPELRAVIQADREVTHGRVMAVLDRLKVAGLSRVAFGAVQAPPAPQPPPGGTAHP